MRLTPAMNMPEALFDELFDKVDRAAAAHPSSRALVQNYGTPELLALGKAAFLEE